MFSDWLAEWNKQTTSLLRFHELSRRTRCLWKLRSQICYFYGKFSHWHDVQQDAWLSRSQCVKKCFVWRDLWNIYRFSWRSAINGKVVVQYLFFSENGCLRYKVPDWRNIKKVLRTYCEHFLNCSMKKSELDCWEKLLNRSLELLEKWHRC